MFSLMPSPNSSLCETLHSTVIDSDPIDSMFETFGEVTAVRLSARQLYAWNMKVENILDETCWNHVTHLIMEELYIDKDHKVQFSNTTSELINITTYLPWLRALKRKYHWIKIFWSFIPCAHHLVICLMCILNFIVCRCEICIFISGKSIRYWD